MSLKLSISLFYSKFSCNKICCTMKLVWVLYRYCGIPMGIINFMASGITTYQKYTLSLDKLSIKKRHMIHFIYTKVPSSFSLWISTHPWISVIVILILSAYFPDTTQVGSTYHVFTFCSVCLLYPYSLFFCSTKKWSKVRFSVCSIQRPQTYNRHQSYHKTMIHKNRNSDNNIVKV